MAGANRRRLLACYLIILRRRRRRNIEGSIGFGYGLCSKTEFLANRFRDVFSGSSVLIILRQFVVKTFVPLYFFNKCIGVIRVACRHFEARTWTRSKQSSASWDMSQRFCRFYRLNPVSIKKKSDRLRVISGRLCRKDRTRVYLGRLIVFVARIVLSDR